MAKFNSQNLFIGDDKQIQFGNDISAPDITLEWETSGSRLLLAAAAASTFSFGDTGDSVSLQMNATGPAISSFIDDDTMATASATSLATSESIKAYVDSQVSTANNDLDEAYDAFTAAKTVTMDDGDLTWALTGAYSMIIDLSAATGDADGFFIEDTDNSDYIRATMNNTGSGINWSAVVSSISFVAAGTVDIESGAGSSMTITSGKSLTIDASTGMSLYADSSIEIGGSTAGEHTPTVSINAVQTGTSLVTDPVLTLKADAQGGASGDDSTVEIYALAVTDGASNLYVGRNAAADEITDSIYIGHNSGTIQIGGGSGSATNDTYVYAGSGGLLLYAKNGGDVDINASGDLIVSDQYQGSSTYSGELHLSDASGEWDTFETNFGEVSILNAINQAYAAASAENLWDRTGTMLGTHTAGDGLDIDASGSSTIELNAAAASWFTVAGASLTLSTTTSGDIDLSAAANLDLDGATVDIDSAGALSLDAGAASNLTTSAGALTLDGASGVNITGNASEVDITTTGTVDVNGATVEIDATGGFSIDGATASNVTVSGATADLTLGARGATITLNENGQTTLSGYTATSVVGALNELKTAVSTLEVGIDWQDSVLDIADNTAAPPTENSGDRYILDNTGASHADWDGAGAWDLVEFDGSSWNVIYDASADEGGAAWVEDVNRIYVHNGTDWVLMSSNMGLGAGSSASDTLRWTGSAWEATSNFTVDGSGNVDVAGTITAGSGNNQITTSAGLIDATKSLITDSNGAYTSTTIDGALNELSGTTGGAIIGLADAGGYFTTDTVEAALQQLAADSVSEQIQHGREVISLNDTEEAVTFGTAFGDTNYTLTATLQTTDGTPSGYTVTINSKASTGFTAVFSGAIDSANYVLEWIAIND